MTWKQKYNQNKKLIELYDKFIFTSKLAYESRLKLMTEIGRLNLQNKRIEQMPVSEFHKDTNDYKFKIDWMSCNTI